MSPADNTLRDQTMPSELVPKSCVDCRGLQPASTSVEIEDLQPQQQLIRLIRKASIAQQMLSDVMKQLSRQQQQQQQVVAKGHKARGRHHDHDHKHSHSCSFSSSCSDSSINSDCELVAVELASIELQQREQQHRRHMRKDRKRDRSRSRGHSRGRSRGHSRGRSHGRSRSRSHTKAGRMDITK